MNKNVRNIKVDADKIVILNIRTLQGNIECAEDAEVDKVAAHKFQFELEAGMDTDKHIIGQKLKVDISAFDKNERPLSIKGSYTHEMAFRVDNLLDHVNMKGERKLLDPVLGSTLVGILYSTVRGIIFTRTQGTSLGTVVLPVVPPLRLMGLEKLTEEQEEVVGKQAKSEKTDNTSKKR